MVLRSVIQRSKRVKTATEHGFLCQHQEITREADDQGHDWAGLLASGGGPVTAPPRCSRRACTGPTQPSHPVAEDIAEFESPRRPSLCRAAARFRHRRGAYGIGRYHTQHITKAMSPGNSCRLFGSLGKHIFVTKAVSLGYSCRLFVGGSRRRVLQVQDRRRGPRA